MIQETGEFTVADAIADGFRDDAVGPPISIKRQEARIGVVSEKPAYGFVVFAVIDARDIPRPDDHDRPPLEKTPLHFMKTHARPDALALKNVPLSSQGPPPPRRPAPTSRR